MFIAKVTDGQVGEIIDFRTYFGMTTSVTDEQLEAEGFVKVNLYREHNRLIQKLVPCNPVLEDGWVYTVAIADLTSEEIQTAKDSAMAQIRGQRNSFLASCDWTQIADSTADKVAWAIYRQQLRELPSKIVAMNTDPRTFSDWPHDPNWVERTI
jgi:hypothetical protein